MVLVGRYEFDTVVCDCSYVDECLCLVYWTCNIKSVSAEGSGTESPEILFIVGDFVQRCKS